MILPGLDASHAQDEQRLLLWLEQRGELLLAPISEAGRRQTRFTSIWTRIERRKAEHETARLLYVAATRARRRLHLLASVKMKDDGSIAEPAAGSFLKLLWPTVARRSRIYPRTAQARAAQRGANASAALPADWKVPARRLRRWSGSVRNRAIELPQVTFEWVSDRSRYAGTALHGFLQRIAREGLDAWDENGGALSPAQPIERCSRIWAWRRPSLPGPPSAWKRASCERCAIRAGAGFSTQHAEAAMRVADRRPDRRQACARR